MNFNTMTKEQKQYVFLGAIVGVTSIFASVQFVIVPVKNNWLEARSELEGLQADVEKADRMIASERSLRQNLSESDAQISDAIRLSLPDVDNPLAWATQNIYQQARAVGIDIQAISEVGSSQVLNALVKEKHRTFGSYAVRVSTNCGYADVGRLIATVESGNPYASVTGIAIDARSDRPQSHTIMIDVEWPVLSDTDLAEKIVNEKGENHG